MTSPLFYRIDDLSQGVRRVLGPGITTRIFSGEHAMISVVQLAPHATSPVHSHPEEQWGVLLRGGGVRVQDGDRVAVDRGDFWLTPGGVPHAFEAGASGALVLDVFSPPRADYAPAGRS